MTTSHEVESYPLNAPEFFEDPYPIYHRMRQHDPVYWSESLGTWILTRYDDVLAMHRNPALTNALAEASVRAQVRDSGPSLAADYIRIVEGMMVMKDGPEHHRLRVLTNRAFTPSALQRWLPKIERVVDELMDALMPKGHMDLISDLAGPLPAIVIAELFGIPPEDREIFHNHSMTTSRLFGGAVGNSEEIARAANEAIVYLERYFLDLLEQRRRQPSDDLTSLLLQGQADGRLTADEVTSQCIMLLGAGHITTMDQLGNTILALLKHPDQMDRLRNNLELVQSAVEEGLRFDGTSQFSQRLVCEDFMLRGKTIRKGDLLRLTRGAANRDPEVFSEPDQFDIGRADNPHLAFGAGPHQCPGMTLARRELEIALGRLVQRMPRLRFDEERPMKRRMNSQAFRGLVSLPVRFD